MEFGKIGESFIFNGLNEANVWPFLRRCNTKMIQHQGRLRLIEDARWENRESEDAEISEIEFILCPLPGTIGPDYHTLVKGNCLIFTGYGVINCSQSMLSEARYQILELVL